jgi:hypothetical protein
LTGNTKARILVLSLRPTLLVGILVPAKMTVVLSMMIALARKTVLAKMTVAAKTVLAKISVGTEMTALGVMTMSAHGAMMMSAPGAMMMSAPGAMTMIIAVMVVGGVTASLPPMWTPLVRFAPFMAILQVTAGGATPMIRRTIVIVIASVMTRVRILLLMVLIPIGIRTRVQLITLLLN